MRLSNIRACPTPNGERGSSTVAIHAVLSRLCTARVRACINRAAATTRPDPPAVAGSVETVGPVAARTGVGLGRVGLGAAERVVAEGAVVPGTGAGANPDEHDTSPRPAATARSAATALVLPLAGTAHRVALTRSS